MNALPDVKLYTKARQTASVMQHVLAHELKLQAPSAWYMTTDERNGLTWLLAIMDVRNLGGALGRYATSGLLHQLSTALGGMRVVISNHSGLRYAALLHSEPKAVSADVRTLDSWTGPDLLLGVNRRGLVTVDMAKYPHLMIAGTTGSGKSRYGLRTLMASALVDGWIVVAGGRMLDFQPFMSHPNFHPVEFSPKDAPLDAVRLLRRVYAEMDRREQILIEKGVSLWSQTGAPKTMVVLDEFSNLADALADIRESETFWRLARLCTREARKYGMHMLYALQDPTHESIDLRVRRNTTPVAFRVKDAAVARVMELSCAEVLPERYFLAGLHTSVRGMAFALSDDDVANWLERRPAKRQAMPAWLDADVTEANDPGPSQEIRRLAETIKSAWSPGMSKRRVAAMLGYPQYGGAYATKVDQIIAYLGATTTTNVPHIGLEAGTA